jgi:hypothetical protein
MLPHNDGFLLATAIFIQFIMTQYYGYRHAKGTCVEGKETNETFANRCDVACLTNGMTKNSLPNNGVLSPSCCGNYNDTVVLLYNGSSSLVAFDRNMIV